MKIKKVLILIFFVFFIFIQNVYGLSTESININKVNFGNKFNFSQNTLGSPFFFMSQVKFASKHKGNVLFFYSSGIIEGEIDGNVYSLFADVTIMDGAKINGNVKTLSSTITINKNTNIRTTPLPIIRDLFFKATEDENNFIYTDIVPAVAISLLIAILRETICLIILGVNRGFFQQGSVTFINDPFDTLRFGVVSYACIFALFLVFLLSIVGFALSAIIAVLAFACIMVGQVSLNIMLGEMITSQMKIKHGVYINAAVGGVIVEIMTFLPIVGIVFNLAFMPVLCLGILITTMTNSYIRKRFYETPYDLPKEADNNWNFEEIRDIIISKKE